MSKLRAGNDPSVRGATSTADALCELAPSLDQKPNQTQAVADANRHPACSGSQLAARTLGRATTSLPGPGRSHHSEERLIELCRGGDEQAFATIVERYRAPLLCHCRGIASEDAQDAVQQAFIEAWSALRAGTEVRHLRAWLFTIARRAALRGLRRRGELSELPETLAGGDSPAEQFEQAAAIRDILAAIADLPDTEHDALVSMSVHGRSARATARELGVSEGAVRQLVFRARARVRSAAAALVPPIPALGLLGRSGHARRMAALGNSAPSVSASPLAAGPLTKLAMVALLGAGVGAPIVALRRGPEEHPSRVARATEHGAVSHSLARSGETRMSRSRDQPAVSTRRSAVPATKPADGAAADAIAAGSPALTATPAPATGEGASGAGAANGSRSGSGRPTGTIEPRPGPVVEGVKHLVGLAPPVAHLTIAPAPAPAAVPLPRSGQVADEVEGTKEAVGQTLQEAVPPPPKAPPSLP